MTVHTTPPTPDPRERGESLLPCPFCGGAAEFERVGTGRQSCIVSCTDCGARLETGETFASGASWNRRAALRAPAPSEAVRKFSAAHTRAMSELEFTHGVGVRGDAPSEAVPEDERCEVCVERRATIHLEGAVNELCAECHIERLERVVNGPVGETRRLLASFIQRVGDNCRLDADGYCQGHFLERGDQCTVKRARDLLAALPAPARGVTVTEAMVERAYAIMRDQYKVSIFIGRGAVREALTAALTPDAEGGA